ncbi:MAG: hypothetical protein AAGB12_12595, partial [Pseudomonadota bacterium]
IFLTFIFSFNTFAYEFNRFLGTPDYSALNHRLCAAANNPDEVEEKWFIDCDFDGKLFAQETPEPKNQIEVMAFNMERGYELDSQIEAFLSGQLPMPDVLLLSEADRGCSRSNYRNTAEEIAQSLKMNFVLFRHTAHGNDVYIPAPKRFQGIAEARLGTRADMIADIKIGENYVRVASVHYDDGIDEKFSQTEQAKETIAFLKDSPIPVIVGGDMNSHYYFLNLRYSLFDSTTRAFRRSGWYDAHELLGFNARDRKTINNKIIGIAIDAVVDVIFSNKNWVVSAQVCSDMIC